MDLGTNTAMRMKKKTFSLKYVKTKAVTGICQTFQSFVKKKQDLKHSLVRNLIRTGTIIVLILTLCHCCDCNVTFDCQLGWQEQQYHQPFFRHLNHKFRKLPLDFVVSMTVPGTMLQAIQMRSLLTVKQYVQLLLHVYSQKFYLISGIITCLSIGRMQIWHLKTQLVPHWRY